MFASGNGPQLISAGASRLLKGTVATPLKPSTGQEILNENKVSLPKKQLYQKKPAASETLPIVQNRIEIHNVDEAYSDNNDDDEDEGDIDEVASFNNRLQIYRKQSLKNPLTKDKGSVSNADMLSQIDETDNTKILFQKKPKLNSKKVSRQLSQGPSIRNLDNIQKEHDQIQQNHLIVTKKVQPVSHSAQQIIEELKQGELALDVSDDEIESAEQNKYMLKCENFSQLTLRPPMSSSSDGEGADKSSSSGEQQHNVEGEMMVGDADSSLASGDHKLKLRADSLIEMNKLLQIEQVFFKRQPSIDPRSPLNGGGLPGIGQGIPPEFLRIETADFPMKLLTHALIEETPQSYDSSCFDQNGELLQQYRTGGGFSEFGFKQSPGTPRFPTDEEIEVEERRLLLTFAFKENEEIEKYRKEMNHLISQEFIVERPPESKYRELKYKLRRLEPTPQKKTLVFCGIDGLFMFSTQAQIVKSCDKLVKIRKDGIKRRYKIFYRPHLYTFLKTLSQYFELVLYLNEEERVASQWVHVLNSFNTENGLKGQQQPSFDQESDKQKRFKLQLKRKQSISEKFFDFILTREQCVMDKQIKFAYRNREIFLENRSLKNVVFISSDLKDSLMVHQNMIISRPYHGNKYENTLTKLKIYLLKHILDCQDVREIIKRDFLCHLKAPPLPQSQQQQLPTSQNVVGQGKRKESVSK